MKKLKLLLLLLLVLVATGQAEAKKVTLKYRLTKGQEFILEKNIKSEISQEVMGESQTIGSSVTFQYDFKVLGLTGNGDFIIEGELSHVTMNTNSPMGELKFDSDSVAEIPEWATAIMITFGETFQFTLNSNGLVRGFKASESLKQKFDSLTNVTNAQNQMLAGLSSGISSESGLSQMLQGFMIQYPGQAVKKGKTWEKEEEFDQLIPFKTKTIYTLKKSDADGYQINVNKQITQKDSTSIEMQGMTMEYDLSGSGQGTYTIDSESGLVIHGEIVTSITGLISVDSPQLPTPMTIPMTFKTTETATLK